MEEDTFKYLYPFCLVNLPVATIFVLRKSSYPVIVMAAAGMVEYVYFLFAFPIEAFAFHKRAMSTSKPYAQHLRDQFISAFPESPKARLYQRVNEQQRSLYQ